MAKENYVQLIGKVLSVKINKEQKIVNFDVQVIRRNGRIDTPSIVVLSSVFNKAIDIKNDDFVAVKGILATFETTKTFICPECGEKTSEDGLSTVVIAISVLKLIGEYSWAELREFSNNVFLLSTVCTDIQLRELKSGTKNAQYQVAVNRKLNVREQSDRWTDYPFVSSLGEQAEQDYLRMEEGSQCFINGGLQTREINKNHTCSKCGASFNVHEKVLEICPYNTEYLNNCKFDDKKESTN